MGVGVRLLRVSYARISSVASMPPIIGKESFICGVGIGYNDQFTSGTQEQRVAIRTSMTSNGRFCSARALNASTASDPFSAMSTVWPYFESILTTTLWNTGLSSADKTSNFTSFVGATGVDSKTGMSTDARSWVLKGVVTPECMPLSKHHFTTMVQIKKVSRSASAMQWVTTPYNSSEEGPGEHRCQQKVLGEYAIRNTRTGASNTMGICRKCSYSRIVSVCRAQVHE